MIVLLNQQIVCAFRLNVITLELRTKGNLFISDCTSTTLLYYRFVILCNGLRTTAIFNHYPSLSQAELTGIKWRCYSFRGQRGVRAGDLGPGPGRPGAAQLHALRAAPTCCACGAARSSPTPRSCGSSGGGRSPTSLTSSITSWKVRTREGERGDEG